MYEVKVTTTISASHHLRGYEGKCEQVHGHNYKVEATVGTEQLDGTGLAVDFKVLKQHLHKVTGHFDHADLNASDEFKDENPSSENLARLIFHGLRESLADTSVQVLRVTVCETEGNCVTYFE